MHNRILYAVIGMAAITIFLSCNKTPGGPGRATAGKIVYVESNDYHDNANAVLAYRRKADGSLEPLPGSPFFTDGAGLGNPKQVLGPDDNDNTIVISDDGEYLLAVNGGSNTIAVFTIDRSGALTAVPGSPFPSGGQTPCSIAVNGHKVYIANKSFDPLHTITEAPNYVGFTIDGSGRLKQVPGEKVEVAIGSSPSQVLLSRDHRFLFGTDFLAFMITAKQPVGTLLSFDLGGWDVLKMAKGSPYILPQADGGALGLAVHPNNEVLYVGFPVASAFGVYSIDDHSGALTLGKTVSAGAAACWLRTNAEGSRLYVLNSGENSVGIYSTVNPSSPVFLSKLALKENGPGYPNGKGGMSISSEDFALGFSPDGDWLYVVSQNTNPDFTAGNFNYLHTLKVADDGSLTEPMTPVQLPVGADVRPQGVATR